MTKCINLANSSFNLNVLNIKLAQNTKLFRRLVLESFITVIHFLFVEKALYGLRPWVFGQLNIFHCVSKPLPCNVQNMVTHIQAKAYSGTPGGGGGKYIFF